MKTKSNRDRIPSEDMTAYERWELPLLDENGKRRPSVEDGEQDVRPLTAEDIENIRKEAYDDGHAEGLEAGTKKGLDQGAREGYKLGYEEGHSAGREDGEKQGLEESRTASEERLKRLDAIVSELLNPLERQEEAVEAALVNLTMAVVRSVIHRELQIDSSQISTLVSAAIRALPNPDEQVRIRVNPADFSDVSAMAEKYATESRVLADEAVMPGGCLVENDHSLVDFTVEKRFQKAVQQMLDKQLSEPDGESAELGAMMGELSDFHREVLDKPDEEAPATADAEPEVSQEEPPEEQRAETESPEQASPDPQTPPADSGPEADKPPEQGDHEPDR